MWGRFNVKKAANAVTSSPNGVDNPGLYLGPGDTGGLAPAANKPRGERNSFCTLTLEALPRVDHYKNTKESIKRPSLGELHGEPQYLKEDDAKTGGGAGGDVGGGHGIKLGWIQGVLIPCLLNIWGVMLFLRLSWVVSQSGIGESLLIIAISAIVCVITTLSLSAISTNGEVKGGGVYYIISRSLGPEFGASVGVILAFANAVAASMNTIGFCSSLNDLLKENNVKIVDGGVNDIRIVGVCAIFVMIIICAIGMEWESKAQNILVIVILAAILNFLVGAAIGPLSDEQKAKGFVGFDTEVFASNWAPDYRYSEKKDQNFFSVFSIFFPSVTGIQAGANISGDLKDPAESIPKGTLLALGISMFSYALFVVFAGGAAMRDASGNVADYNNYRNYTQCVLNNHTCNYGLHNDYTVMQLMSGWGYLIYAGCFAATISTALTNLLSVPRLVQALGIDRVYPGLMFFSKGYGKAGEPYRGYVLTFLISSAFVLMADLNAIAPLISNFYLASYALINFCTFHAALIKALGWRPTFKYYNMWLSLFGFFLCVLIMFLIDWETSLITFAVFFVLYVIVVYRKPDANWGSSTQAQIYKTALLTVQKLASSSEHVKNYQPQLLVLSGPPQNRPALIDLANLITKHNSLLVCAEILKERLLYRSRMARIRAGCDWLAIRKVKGFFTIVDGLRMEDGTKALMQSTGVGKLRPNVLLMGYKSDWQTCSFEDLQTYFNILHDAFANRLAVAILRVPEGLDYTKGQNGPETIPEELSSSLNDLTVTAGGATISSTPLGLNGLKHADSNLSILQPQVLSQTSLTIAGIPKTNDRPSILTSQLSWTSTPTDLLKSKKKEKANKHILHKFPDGQELHKAVLESMRIFDKKYKGGYIDVWWLYDDGGLTILLPYIIGTRQIFSNCKMRIFALANRHHDLKVEELNMASLLSKFRIEYESLKMINNIMDEPKRETQEFFSNLINNFKESSAEYVINESELITLREKTDRQLRLRELLQEHSKESTLVFMSLPMPRKGLVSAPLYMAWLEAITKDMPPFVLVRGNQASVLTFYS